MVLILLTDKLALLDVFQLVGFSDFLHQQFSGIHLSNRGRT